MTTTIYKYPLPVDDDSTVAMPDGARILCVQTQHDAPMLWALVNPGAPLVLRHFHVAGTGHPIPATRGVNLIYIGTVQLMGGTLVFHVFERVERERGRE